MKLDDITLGQRVAGISGAQHVEIVAIKCFGADVLSVTHRASDVSVAERVLFGASEPALRPDDASDDKGFEDF